jgi:hypothetical protein
LLDRWAAYILAGGAGLFGLIWGMKRAQIGNNYRLAQIEREIGELQTRVKALEVQGTAEAISLARIQATLDNVLEYLQDLKSEIRGKADK